MKKLSMAVVLGTLVSSAFADILHDNGPYITHPNAVHSTLGNVNVSQLQNVTLGDTTLGYSAYGAYRMADDFTVGAGQVWTVNRLTVFGYSTNFATAPSGGNARIWSGDPGAGGTIIYDGSAVNLLLSATFDALRIAESTNAGPPFTDVARQVFKVDLGIPNVVLNPGQYWVDYQFVPTSGAASVFAPPVTIPGQGNTSAGGAARQANGTTWGAPLTQGTSLNPVDMPFILSGTAVPEPATMAVLGLGAAALLRRRKKA